MPFTDDSYGLVFMVKLQEPVWWVHRGRVIPSLEYIPVPVPVTKVHIDARVVNFVAQVN